MEIKVRELIKAAMIEKNKDKQIAYKSILENAQKIAKRTNDDVTDDMIITATKNEIKSLNDLLEYAVEGSELYNATVNKINYCEVILPAMASPDDIMNYLIGDNIDKNIGACMKALKQKFGANMDGKVASGVAREYCNSDS